MRRVKEAFRRAVDLDFGPPVYSRRTRTALLIAIPVAATMLLICNSFNISVVRDPAAPFASDRIPVEPTGDTGIEP